MLQQLPHAQGSSFQLFVVERCWKVKHHEMATCFCWAKIGRPKACKPLINFQLSSYPKCARPVTRAGPSSTIIPLISHKYPIISQRYKLLSQYYPTIIPQICLRYPKIVNTFLGLFSAQARLPAIGKQKSLTLPWSEDASRGNVGCFRPKWWL